jgi:isochorismate hydrolase
MTNFKKLQSILDNHNFFIHQLNVNSLIKKSLIEDVREMRNILEQANIKKGDKNEIHNTKQ